MSGCTECRGKGYLLVGHLIDGSDDHEQECSTCKGLGCVCNECGVEMKSGDLCVSCCLNGLENESEDGGDEDVAPI